MSSYQININLIFSALNQTLKILTWQIQEKPM